MAEKKWSEALRDGAIWLCFPAAAAVLMLMVWFTRQPDWPELGHDLQTSQAVELDSFDLFDTGSAQLRPGSENRLVNVLAHIKTKPGWLIVIAGHADASGDALRNLELSRARANAVRDWIKQVGEVPDSCFAIQAFAATLPLSSNDTPAGRAANRRVQIRLVPDFGACSVSEQGPLTTGLLQLDLRAQPATLAVAQGQLPPHGLGQLLRNRQPQTGATGAAVA